ncbi:MAG: AI-2E family transporter [Acidimicrobiia bacterium]
MSDSATPPPPDTESEDRRNVQVTISGDAIWKIIGAVLITLATLWMMGQARHLIALVAFSFFLSLALQPLVMRIVHRWDWKRGSAVGVIYLAGMIGFIVLVLVLIPAIAALAGAIGESGSEWIQGFGTWLNETFGFEIPEGGFDGDVATDIEDEILAWLQGAAGNILGIATSGIGLIFDMATIAMFTFYFTADAPRFQRTVLSLLDEDEQARVGWTWDQAIVQTGGYFYSRFILMMINATGFFFTMVLVGVPVGASVALALFGGFVAAFIPAIGTYLGSAVPILVTLVVSGWVGALIVLGYAIAYQQIENYWLSPKISSDTMTLNGAVAFGAALAGGAIGGPIGAFVALPVAALITAFVGNFVQHNDVVYEFEYDKHEARPGDADSSGSKWRPSLSRKSKD